MPATLRDATEADLPEVMRFIHALAVYERLADEVTVTEQDLRDSLFGPVPRAFALLAEQQGRAVGFAVWFRNFSTFEGKAGLYVEDVFVEADCRGQGIGRAIFAHLAARALADGAPRLEWSVLNWNQPAITFYRGLGAEPRVQWTGQRLSGQALSALAGTSE